MDKQVQQSLLEIRSTISALEKQIDYLRKLSVNQEYNDEVIEQKLHLVTSKLLELEQTVLRIELQVDRIEQRSPTYETYSKKQTTRSAKRTEDTEEDSDDTTLTWPLIVSIIVAVMSFLAGPVIEIIKYLLR